MKHRIELISFKEALCHTGSNENEKVYVVDLYNYRVEPILFSNFPIGDLKDLYDEGEVVFILRKEA